MGPVLVAAWIAGWLATIGPAEVPPPPADPVPVDLRWVAPAPCPDRDALLEALGELAGRHLVVDSEADLYVEGMVERVDDGFALELTLRSPKDGTERRDLHAGTCEALVDAASVVMLTRLLPDHVPTASSPERIEEVPYPTPPSVHDETDDPVAASSVAPEPPPPPPPKWRFAGSLLGGVAAGLGPRIAPTVRVGLGTTGPHVRIEAYALHAFAEPSPPPGDVGVRVTYSGAVALGCGVPAVRRVEFPLCSGISLGGVRGEGVGTLQSSTRAWQLAVGVPIEGGVAWVPMPRVALRAQVGGIVALRQPAFHIDDRGTNVASTRTWPMAVTAGLGAELRLP